MTFVNEAISNSELDESDLLRSIRTLNGDPISAGHPQTWAIDRERDARLISLGGGGGPIPMMFAFVWMNSIMQL